MTRRWFLNRGLWLSAGVFGASLLAGCSEEEGCTAYVDCRATSAEELEEAFESEVSGFWDDVDVSSFRLMSDAAWRAWLPVVSDGDGRGFSQAALSYDVDFPRPPELSVDDGGDRVLSLLLEDEDGSGRSRAIRLSEGVRSGDPDEELTVDPFSRLRAWTFLSQGNEAVAYLSERRDLRSGDGLWLADGVWAWNGGDFFHVGGFVSAADGLAAGLGAESHDRFREQLRGRYLVGFSDGLHVWQRAHEGRITGGAERVYGVLDQLQVVDGDGITLRGGIFDLVSNGVLRSFEAPGAEVDASVISTGDIQGIGFYAGTPEDDGGGTFGGVCNLFLGDTSGWRIPESRHPRLQIGAWHGALLTLAPGDFLTGAEDVLVVGTWGVPYVLQKSEREERVRLRRRDGSTEYVEVGLIPRPRWWGENGVGGETGNTDNEPRDREPDYYERDLIREDGSVLTVRSRGSDEGGFDVPCGVVDMEFGVPCSVLDVEFNGPGGGLEQARLEKVQEFGSELVRGVLLGSFVSGAFL